MRDLLDEANKYLLEAKSCRLSAFDFKDFLDKVYNEGGINDSELDMILNALDGKKVRSASVRSNLLSVLLTCAVALSGGTSCSQSSDYNTNPPIEQSPIADINCSDDDVTLVAFNLIKKYEGKVLGNVIVDGVKLKNVHVVYDDKKGASKAVPWDGNFANLKSFIKNCTGKPTIGYGLTSSSIVKRGYLTEEDAVELSKKHIKDGISDVREKIGEAYWKKMNLNQCAAMVSLYYNIGVNANTPKTIKHLQNLLATNDYEFFKKSLKGFYKEFTDCNKADGKVNKGLTNRRNHEYKVFEAGTKFVEKQ